MMKCISIVSTQLQLLNCIEFVAEHKISHHTLILYAASDKRLIQLQKLLSLPFISDKIDVTYKIIKRGTGIWFYINTLINRYRLYRIFKKNKYNYCVIGNYHNIAHRNLFFLANENKDISLVHLDDGLAIADCIVNRKTELQSGVPKFTCSRSELYLYNYRLNRHIPNSITFFTPYKVHVDNQDLYVNNQYSYLKKATIDNCQLSPINCADVVILGQPLVANGILKKSTYSNVLLQELARISPQKLSVFYLPHPVEKIEDSLDNELINMVHICKSELPFELQCMSIRKTSVVIGFYTSALSCLKTFGIECDSYALRPVFDTNDKEELKIIYEAYDYLLNVGLTIKDV